MENFRATVINQSGLRINEALSTQARFRKPSLLLDFSKR